MKNSIPKHQAKHYDASDPNIPLQFKQAERTYSRLRQVIGKRKEIPRSLDGLQFLILKGSENISPPRIIKLINRSESHIATERIQIQTDIMPSSHDVGRLAKRSKLNLKGNSPEGQRSRKKRLFL